MTKKWKTVFCAFFAALLLAAFVNPAIYTEAEESEIKPSDLYAQSAVLMDADSGVFYLRKADKKKDLWQVPQRS